MKSDKERHHFDQYSTPYQQRIPVVDLHQATVPRLQARYPSGGFFR